MRPALPSPAWLVGCGNMAGALVEGWKSAGIELSGVTAIRPSGRPVPGVQTVTQLPDGTPRFAMLGFKPQMLDEIVPNLAPRIGRQCILVSILAGVAADSLRDRFPAARAIVRVMPNLPVAQRAGVVALYSDDDDAEARGIVSALMSVLGLAPWCCDQRSFSAIGAVAGAGPAYFARFTAALAKGGEKLGLDPDMAAAVAAQLMVGTGTMVGSTGETMDDLARRVASPKGTTEQGLAVLDGPDGLQPLIDRMLAAALRRGEELAAAARRN